MKSILKKTMAYFLTFAMLITLMPLTAIPVSAELSGTGAEDDPILIGTLADLEAFRESVNSGDNCEGKYVLLTDDIEMSGKYGNGKQSWTPIGKVQDFDYDAKVFNGTFDGNGHTISGLYIKSNTQYQGLFGCVGKNGTVKNFRISGEVIVNNNEVGLAVGYNLGTISNVRASGAANGVNSVGLVAGKNGADIYNLSDTKRAKIENSHADGTVNGYHQVGLIAGLNKSLISKCSSSGTFSLNNLENVCNAGGICGENSDGNATVEYSYNAAKYADNTNNNKLLRVGGICGENKYSAKISYCYNTSTIEAYNAAGIACLNYNGTIRQCYQYGRTKGPGETGYTKFEGDVNPIAKNKSGTAEIGTVIESYYFINNNHAEYPGESGKVVNSLSFQDELVGWDLDKVWKMDAILGRPFLRNNLERGSADKPHEITSRDDLSAFRNSVNNGNTYEGEYLRLTTDIRYGSIKWTPIGTCDAADENNSKPFKGNFDGEGHLIFDWDINAPESDFQGLFGYTDGAAIKNLRMSGEVTGKNYVGMIVGYSKDSRIENVTAQGKVSGKQYVGGIAGKNDSGTMTTNQNRAAISGDEYVGGIAGFTSGYTYASFNTAEITGKNYVGGIAGMCQDDIRNCYNIGNITGTGTATGGICGSLERSEIFGVYNIGTVSRPDNTSGAIYGEKNIAAVNCAYCLAEKQLGTTRLTADEFKKQESFGSLDFKTAWVMNPYLGRPVLRSCTEYAGGTEQGTEADPYTINNLDDLEAFRDSVNSGETYEGKYIKLSADIDMSEKYGADINGQEVNWTAIGDYNSKKTFSGSFDGDNHKITGLYINGGSDNRALFSYIGNSGAVKNLTVSGEVMNSSLSGIVAAVNEGTIKNVCASGNVNGMISVGGICGSNGGTIENSSNEATITGSTRTGGICGDNSGSIKNCYNTGSVTGSEWAGGICGSNNTRYGITIQNCYNAAPVTGNECVGGICGLNYDASISNCYNVGAVTATNKTAGGICGGTTGEISSCYNYANVTANEKKAAICGSTYPLIPPKNNYYNGDTFDGTNYNRDDGSGEPVYTGRLSESEFADQTKFIGFDFENTWVMNEQAGRPMLKGMEEPDGSEYNPLKIHTLADLEKFSESVNGGNDYTGKKVLLMADIDMSGEYGEGKKSWTPIGHWFDRYDFSTWFNGTFEGNGHKITGLYIERDAEDQGLFGNANTSSVIRDLTVSGNVSGTKGVGMLVGWNIGVIENVTVYGSANGTTMVGGIVGYNDTSDSYIKQCTNFAAISGEDRVGGIVGSASNSTVQECRNMGTVYASKYYAGGICGLTIDKIQNCYNTAPVSADDYGAGGIVGNGYKMQNCYNIAAVSAGNEAGGIAGFNGSAENCYNIGRVSADENAGGIIGFDGTAENSYHTITDADNGIGTFVTEAQLAGQNNFATWDFDTVWRMNPLLGRPVLHSNVEGESGTEDDPYLIDSLEMLEKFRNNVNNGLSFAGKFVKLTKDIDLDEKYGSTKEEWTPIGTQEKPFSGTFDGNGYSISGLYINDWSKTYQGLFGSVSGGTIKKLAVTNAQVAAYQYFGGIAAEVTNGTIENCYYSGKLSASENGGGYYGAIVGELETGTLKNCYASVEIPLYSPYDSWSGGVIAGTAYYSKVTSCYFNQAGNENRIAVGRSPQSTVDSYTGGKTAEELAKQSTYFGWDFENVWSMHPILRLPTFAGGGFSGTGTEQDPYILTTLADLDLLASSVNTGNHFEKTYFALGADIDMSEKYNAESGKSWTPIGNSRDNAFSGVLDGRNHKITGLFIKNRTDDYTGLFGYLSYADWHVEGETYRAAVKNLTVSGSITGSGTYTGGIAGCINTGAMLEGCSAAVDITSASGIYDVGGLAGDCYGTIKNSFASGNISAEGSVGGLVGYHSGDLIQNCYTLGSVTGNSSVGGLIGNSTGTVVNSYSLAEVTGGKPLFGFGWGTVKNCYYTGDTEDTFSDSVKKTQAQFESGEVAYLLSKGCTISEGSSDSKVYNGSIWKQTLGKDSYPSFTGKTVSCTAGCPSYNNDGDTAERAHTPNADGVCTVCGAYKGAELVDGVYQIQNSLDLIWFAELVNSGANTANANVTNDIALNDKVFDADGNLLDGLESFTPIGTADNPYSGTFCGNSHIISGIYISNSEMEYAGLFGSTAESAVIKNVIIQKSYVGASKYVGLLVGQNSGTVEFCIVDGTAEKLGYSSSYGDFIGGVCGENNGTITGDVNSPLFAGNLLGSGRAMGGICGSNTGTVTNAVNSGTIETSGARVGGIAGVNDCTDDKDGIITGSANYGSVSGDSIVGGICGENYAIVKNCSNAAMFFYTYVIAQTYAGGICGKNNGSVSRCVNHEQASVISNDTNSYYGYAGGIAAANGEDDISSISDCINASSQISGKTIGGIAGMNERNGTMQYCMNTAFGGIVGERRSEDSSIVNCFYPEASESYAYGTAATAEQFADGYVLEKLQNNRSEAMWEQNIGTDPFPNLSTAAAVSPSIEVSGNTVVFHAPKGTYTAVFAAYDETGKLLQTVTDSVIIGETGTASVSLDSYLNSDGAKTKIMLWNSLDSMTPVCSNAEI